MVCPITQGGHKEEEEDRNHRAKNTMACPITLGGHKQHLCYKVGEPKLMMETSMYTNMVNG